jgi:hypothetical protein
MTTRLRQISQIPATIQYLQTIVATNAWVPNARVKVESIVTESAFAAGFSGIADITTGNLLRDMGKSFTLVDSKGVHVATLRLVQIVLGGGSEGVPVNYDGNGQFYVSTWTTNPVSSYNVTVTRTG